MARSKSLNVLGRIAANLISWATFFASMAVYPFLYVAHTVGLWAAVWVGAGVMASVGWDLRNHGFGTQFLESSVAGGIALTIFTPIIAIFTATLHTLAIASNVSNSVYNALTDDCCADNKRDEFTFRINRPTRQDPYREERSQFMRTGGFNPTTGLGQFGQRGNSHVRIDDVTDRPSPICQLQ